MSPTDPGNSPRGGLFRRTIRRRWVQILSQGALLTVALMSAVYVMARGDYRASSVLRVDPEKMKLYGIDDRPESLDAFLKTQVQLINSPNVLTAAATNPKAAVLPRIKNAGDVVQELRKVIKVQVVPETYLIEVSAESRSSYEAATLVNSVVDSFMEANIEWSDGMTRTQIKNLETYLGDLRNRSDEMERRWKELVSRGDADQKSKQANLISPAHGRKIEEKLIEDEIRLLELQGRFDALKASPNPDPKKLEDLTTEIAAVKNLDEALKARRASAGYDPRRAATDQVEIALIGDQRESLKTMQEAVIRRLEQLKFEAKGEARIRPVNSAVPPGRPINFGNLPWILLAIPFATFAAVFVLFAGVEARSGAKASAGKVEPAEVVTDAAEVPSPKSPRES